MGFVVILIVNVLCGLIPAAVARQKGRNFFLWWLYGTVLFIIALVHALFFLRPAKPNSSEPQPVKPGLTKKATEPSKGIELSHASAQAPSRTATPAAATPETTRVFISHSSKDQKIAETICAALESRGIQCWFSARDVDPGENFQASIHRAIKSAKVMVLVFSSNANTSPEINKEIALAGQHELTVIPVRTEDVVANDALGYELATRQWIDLFSDWERAIDRLSSRIAAVDTHLRQSSLSA